MKIKVECNLDICSELTKGKIYDVNYDFMDYLVITNDLGNRKKYPVKYFKDLANKEINSDKINPSYYGADFDVIDFCQKNNLDFMQGNVIKYVTRYKEKNGKEDLFKAMEYIERMIKEINKGDK